MRINITDCDVEEPSANDVAEELEAMRPETRSEYIPYDPSALAHLWLRLIKISSALGLVLQTHYKVSGPRPEVADVQKCEQEIAACYQSFDTIERSDRMMRLFILQLQLFYEFALKPPKMKLGYMLIITEQPLLCCTDPILRKGQLTRK